MVKLQDTVLKHDMCIGCGACAYVNPGQYSVVEDAHGFFKAQYSEGATEEDVLIRESQVCPFADESEDEDQIAARLFTSDQPKDHRIGYYLGCYAGRVADEALYQKSSSGGIARWLLGHLMDTGEIDGVISVFNREVTEKGGNHFEYRLTKNREDLADLSKSAYYPVELSGVLKELRETPGKYAITGVPCFIKAIRNLCRVDPILEERIKFTIGIVCGHLKSKFYGEMLGWQLGVHPDDLRSIDFRKKLPGKKANEKGVLVTSIKYPEKSIMPKTVKDLFGTDYGLGLFKYNACDFCDDVVGETADISIGDAWLPEFMSGGTSLIIVRNLEVKKIIDAGFDAKILDLRAISADDAARSQEGGFRHRRMGLSYRLSEVVKAGTWMPRKRVRPGSFAVSNKYKKIFNLRRDVVKISADVFEQAKKSDSLVVFKYAVACWDARYRLAYSRASRKVFRLLILVKAIVQCRIR